MERRLAAILFTDMVDYSRLIGVDEEGTIARQSAHREDIFDPKISAFGGRIVKTTGDGLLVEFTSVVDAVKCAVEAQRELVKRDTEIPEDRRMQYRMGINLGDIVIDGDDILGDGVNVAARLEGQAKPGGICISGTVYDQLAGKVDVVFEEAGEQTIKNLPRPVRIWHWQADQVAQSPSVLNEPPALPDKPSIAVLPFANISGDPQQEYFVDGVVEDILMTLSRIPTLFVIAQNSSFRYKGQSSDVRDVGRELGVRYVVQGSMRKAGERVRVTAQLVDCADGRHIWADRYDGVLDNLFDFQDQIALHVATELETKLVEGEVVAERRRRSRNPLAYERFVRARELYADFARQAHSQAQQLCNEALSIDANCTPALYLFGLILVDQARFAWAPDTDLAYQQALDIADRALKIDPDYSDIYSIISYARTYQRRHDDAVAAAEKAVAFSPNSAGAFHMSAMAHIYAGNFHIAHNYEIQYCRLSPMAREVALVELARAEFHLNKFGEAREHSSKVLETQPSWLTAKTILLASLWQLGREQEAKQLATDIRSDHPGFVVSRWADKWPYRNADHLDALMEPLRLAGL